MTRKAPVTEAPESATLRRLRVMAWVHTEGAQIVARAQLRRACAKRVTSSPATARGERS
jgi:hypothetical protein